MKKVIAIVGMCGVGKSVACNYLESIGFKSVYFGGVTLDELNEEGLPDTPENEKMIRERLRKEYGMSAYAKLSLPKIKEFSKENDVVIDGLYSWDELKLLQDELDNLIVIGIVCDKELRYERISKRAIRSFNREDAIKRDISEIENLAKGGPIAYANYYIDNNGTIKDLKKRLQYIIDNI